MTTRSARRAQLREAQTQEEPSQPKPRRVEQVDKPRVSPWRTAAFLVMAIVILGTGGYLASSVFLGNRGGEASGALSVRLSMDGFDPKVITAKPGAAISLDFWNTDNAMHLDGGGVHSFIMDDQQVYVKIPAESHKAYTLMAPTKPGDYDFYCDTCCGGKASPTMHGILRVEA